MFEAERAVTEAHGVDLHAIRLSSDSMPSRATVQQLVHLLAAPRGIRAAEGEGLDQEAYPGERGPELVGHVGHEVGLHLIL